MPNSLSKKSAAAANFCSISSCQRRSFCLMLESARIFTLTSLSGDDGRTKEQDESNKLRMEQIIRRRVVIGQYGDVLVGQHAVVISHAKVVDRIGEAVSY